jgi:hypothetical protein
MLTIFEFAVARFVNQLLDERKARPLTRGEERFLARVNGVVAEIQSQEITHDENTARQ